MVLHQLVVLSKFSLTILMRAIAVVILKRTTNLPIHGFHGFFLPTSACDIVEKQHAVSLDYMDRKMIFSIAAAVVDAVASSSFAFLSDTAGGLVQGPYIHTCRRRRDKFLPTPWTSRSYTHWPGRGYHEGDS